jgi:hypothetical protein
MAIFRLISRIFGSVKIVMASSTDVIVSIGWAIRVIPSSLKVLYKTPINMDEIIKARNCDFLLKFIYQ